MLDWITEDENIVLDFIGRYESLDTDWLRIYQRLGVKPVALTMENRIPRADYPSFYDSTSKQLVAERFRRTIQMFGYEF
jgi:hypothetical protein